MVKYSYYKPTLCPAIRLLYAIMELWYLDNAYNARVI